MARRVKSFVVVLVITIKIFQVFGKDGEGCEVRRVPRSDPATPNMIKFSIECSNPQPNDQISAPSDVARTVVEPPPNSRLKSKFAPNPLKLTSLFKKRLVDPMSSAGSHSSPIELPFRDPNIALQKFRSLFKKAPEDHVPGEIPDKLFDLSQDILAALPKPKTSLSELLKKSKSPAFRTLETGASNVDPIKAFRNQRPRFPSLIKKAAEEPKKPADLDTLHEALKNSKLTLPDLMASLLKENPKDAFASPAANIDSIKDAPKLSKFKESKLYSLLKKPEEDPIVSASSDSDAFEKFPKFEKLKLPMLRSLLKTNNDEPEVSANSLDNKFAEAPQLSKLSALEEVPEESIKSSFSDKLEPLRKAPEESIKPSLTDRLAALRKKPDDSIKTTLSEKLAALKRTAENLKKNDDEPIVSASSLVNKFAEAPKLSELSEFIKPPKESIRTILSDKLAALRKAPELIKTSFSDKLGALRKAPEDSINTTLSEKLVALKRTVEDLKKNDDEPVVSASSLYEKFAEVPKLSELSELIKPQEESIKTILSDKLAALRKAPSELIKTSLFDKLEARKEPEEKIKTVISDKISALRKAMERSSLLKKNDEEPEASASSQVNKFAKVPKISGKSLLRKTPQDPIKTTLYDKISSLRNEPENSIKTSLSDKLAALRKAPEEPIKPAFPNLSSKLRTGDLENKFRSFLRKADDPVVSQMFDSAEKLTKPTKLDKVKLSELLKKVSKEPTSSATEYVPAFKAKSQLKALLERSANKDMASAASALSSVVEPKKSKLLSLVKKPSLPKKSLTLDEDPIGKFPFLNNLTPKIETPKAQTAEEMSTLLDRIRNTLSEAVVNGKMDPLKGRSLLKKLSLTKDLDEGAPDVNLVTAETDQGEAADTEKSASNAELVGSAPEDDMIELTQKELDSKSCDLCKCFMKAFPQKFGDSSKSRAATEVEEKVVKPTKFKLPILPSKISDRLREALKPIDPDSFVEADNHAPSFLPAPENREAEGSDNELSEIERGVKIQDGIERLINFVSLVGELDQYVSHKTRNFITKMARLYDGEEHPQLL